jgi:hypothetical protein
MRELPALGRGSVKKIGEIVQPFAIAAVGAHYHMVDTGNLRASPPTFFK